jgi:hypothetical protein
VNDRVILELEGYYPLLCEVRSNLDGSLGLAFLHDVQGQQSLANWLTLKEYGRRRDRRKNIETEARIHRDELELACITQNVSLGGAKAKLEEAAELALGAAVAFEIQGLMPIPAHIRRKIQDTVSVRFDHSPATQNALRDWLQQVPF